MFAKQLSVFIENRSGRLAEVLSVLGKNGVNILSLSLADTTEFGLLRLIVDNSELGKEKLSEAGFSSLLSDVCIIKIAHKAGSLRDFLALMDNSGVNIEYMYGLSVRSDDACIVMKASDKEKLSEIITSAKIETLTCEDIKKL